MSRTLPEPEHGMVVRFQYQWADQVQPVKSRPVCIALVRPVPDPRSSAAAGEKSPHVLKEVVYLPISTQPPRSDQVGIEFPAAVLSILGLKYPRSWVIVSECNVQY